MDIKINNDLERSTKNSTTVNEEDSSIGSSSAENVEAMDFKENKSTNNNKLENVEAFDVIIMHTENTATILNDDVASINNNKADNVEALDFQHKVDDVISNELLPEEVEVVTRTSTVSRSALNMLAEYDSNDDDDDDAESVVEIHNTYEYRNKVIEVSSSSDSESDSSISVVEGETKSARSLRCLRKVIDKSIAIATDEEEEDDDDENGPGSRKNSKYTPAKVKGEFLLEDLPPIENLQITVPEEECIELGRVHSVVDQLLLVSVLPNSLLLDLDTVLFLDKGNRVLGAVFDVLGQVASPLYCIRFNTNEEIKEKNINIGDTVYVAPKTEHTQFVILSSLMKIRGSDASWEHDIEPPPRYLDYSDDEAERQARTRLRNRERKESTETVVREKRRNIQNENDSDDDEDDAMSITSESTVASSRSRKSNGRGVGRRGGRGHKAQQQQQSQPMPNYPPSYNNNSWQPNLYATHPYMYGQYAQQPPLPPPPMAYYSHMPPYGYGHPYPNPYTNPAQNLWAQPVGPMPPPPSTQQQPKQ